MDTRSVFAEFAEMGWNERTERLLLIHFLDQGGGDEAALRRYLLDVVERELEAEGLGHYFKEDADNYLIPVGCSEIGVIGPLESLEEYEQTAVDLIQGKEGDLQPEYLFWMCVEKGKPRAGSFVQHDIESVLKRKGGGS